ncbi:Threonine--tRNA ligase, cytoplasmic [Fulvia fulva]|nr:Threonine--tRNA ligase, cytoplasmic [Fulvia fulva]KAK4612736.1 Threonine--tRNA ligase, cytoplasmic [Fulvia fulva]WPV21155.1 Threonine--tRNA ligase, cytoplasmic [Fulvia fulva]
MLFRIQHHARVTFSRISRTLPPTNTFRIACATPSTAAARPFTFTSTMGKDKKAAANPGDARPLDLNPPPDFFATRNALFDKRRAEYDEWVAKQPREDIEITLPNGNKVPGKSWETTPAQIAREMSKSLYERTVIARVDGDLWDLPRPLEKSCNLELLDFEHPEGKKVFWHSSAHILGEASERRFGCSLCIGPPVDDGFYYEMALPQMAAVSEADHKPLKQIVEKITKEKQKFERLTLTKEELLEMFSYNKYKQHIINDKIPDGTSTTVYRNGPLIDLCRGPHVEHTGRIKAFEIMKNSASYFLGDAKNDSLQRIYGVSFPDKKQLEEHKHMLEEAAKRDHRKIGQEQELFFFDQMSPGSAFWLPRGMVIFNALQSYIREEYWKREYQEVQSPNMYDSALWKQSGHWQHYKDDMFTFSVEKHEWALKPMNCPGHALIFGHGERSYRELPIRMAEFGVLHRNEASGALTGLTRVRRFVQDDTHIFCTEAQIGQEIEGLFDLMTAVYGLFGFTFKMKLSTRPEGHLGDVATWDRAEAQLTKALDEFKAKSGTQWELNPGDGAFYGPKIDITISDALRREFQCATIQLDFQLPQQFNLEYRSEEKAVASTKAEAQVNGDAKAAAEAPKAADGEKTEEKLVIRSAPDARPDPSAAPKSEASYRRELTPGCQRPVMIHRAIYGSFERFIAILIEHFGGKWPFWLSPRQILIVPVMPSANDYVLELQKLFRAQKMHVDIDITGNTMQKKIRTGQLQQYNFIFVVGAQEKENRAVNIRNRDDPETQKLGELIPVDKAIQLLCKLRDERLRDSSLSKLAE